MSSSVASKHSSRSAPQSQKSTSGAYLNDINSRQTRAEQAERERARILIPRLAKRSYHLEDGATWFQDWVQYQRNTHPVFGLCLHHPLHPIRGPQRTIILMGSVAFGLAMTNIVFLGLLNSAETPAWANAIYNVTGQVVDIQHRYTQVDLDQSMFFLWTVGSFLHSLFDMLIWYMSACAWFRPGGITGMNSVFCQNFGLYLAVLFVVFMVFVATLVVVIRLDEDNENITQYLPFFGDLLGDNSTVVANVTDIVANLSQADLFAQSVETNEVILNSSITNSSVANGTGFIIPSFNLADLIYTNDDSKHAFLIGYAVELTIALFVYYPITSTVFFSGILGCGKVPILGGRPYELKKIERKNAAKSNRSEDVLEAC